MKGSILLGSHRMHKIGYIYILNEMKYDVNKDICCCFKIRQSLFLFLSFLDRRQNGTRHTIFFSFFCLFQLNKKE